MRLLLIGLLLGWSLTNHAQQCNLVFEGKVVDFHNNRPLPGAAIEVFNANQKVGVTNFDGEFRIEGLCASRIEIMVSHPECLSQTMTIDLNTQPFPTIYLEHHLEELEEVVVTDTRVHRNTHTAQESRIETETLERYSQSNLGDAIKQLSGVSSLNTGNTIVKPVIQGLHSSRIVVMNQGTRMQDQEWGVDHAPNVDLNTAGSIAVVKGAGALQYGGDAIGGVIIIEPAVLAKTDSIYGKTITSMASNGRGSSLSSGLSFTSSKGWYITGQGTIKRFGDFRAPDYNLTNTGYFEKDFSVTGGFNALKNGLELSYSYFNNEIGILRASHIGNLEDLERAINSDTPLIIEDFRYGIQAPKQQVSHHLAKVKFYQRISGLGKLSMQYDFQFNHRYEYDIRRGELADRPSVDLELSTHTLNTWFDFNAGESYKLKTGIMARYQNNYPNPSTGVRRLIPDYDKYDLGTYIIGSFQLTDQLMAEAGLRYDFNRIDTLKFYEEERWNNLGYNEEFGSFVVRDFGDEILTNPVLDYQNISFTAGVRYHLNAQWQLLANYASATRSPNPAELFSDGLHHSNATIELGELRLDREQSHKISATLLKDYGNFTFGISPFYQRIQNYIFMEPVGAQTTVRGAFPVWQYKQTNAALWGTDLDLSWIPIPNWRFMHKSAFLKARDVKQDRALIDIPAPNLWNSISYTREKWHNLTLELNSSYVFRQNEYPDNNFTISKVENNQLVEKEVDISTPPQAYHLLGFSASSEFAVGRASTLTLRLLGNNMLNTSYRDYLNRLRYYADNLGRDIQLQVIISY